MLVRNSVIFVASRAVPGLLGFATALLLPWFLSPESYGLYGMGLAIVMVANNLLYEWLGACLLRWHETHRDEPAFLPTMLTLFAGISLLMAVLVLAVAATGLLGGYARLACILVFGTVAYGGFEFASRFQVSRSDPVGFLQMTVSRNVMILGGSLLVAHLTHSAEATLLISFAAMAAAACLVGALPRTRGAGRFDRALAWEFAAYGTPVGLVMIFSSLASTATPILIGALAGYQAVGAFTIGYTIVQSTLGVISTGISSASYPAAVRAVERGDPALAQATLARTYTILLAALLPAGIGLAMVAPGIAEAFVAPHYRDAVRQTMPWLAAGAVLMGLRAMYVDYAFYLGKRTWLLVQIIGGAAVVNVLAGVALIPVWRELGAAVAVCCAFATALVHAVLIAGRAFPVPFPRRETGIVVAATLAMAVVLALLPATAHGLFGLAQQVLAGVATYVVTLLALDALTPGTGRIAVVFNQATRRGLPVRSR